MMQDRKDMGEKDIYHSFSMYFFNVLEVDELACV